MDDIKVQGQANNNDCKSGGTTRATKAEKQDKDERDGYWSDMEGGMLGMTRKREGGGGGRGGGYQAVQVVSW